MTIARIAKTLRTHLWKEQRYCYQTVISYTSDIEGDLHHWNRFITHSEVIERCSKTRKLTFKNDNSHFVFGGDVCDRGEGDIRILRDLLQFHDDFPTRVHFIMGNRDVNKLRLLFTLHEDIVRKGDAKVYWLRRDIDNEIMKDENSNRTRTEKLKYVLRRTMGSPNAFEFRKRELKELHGGSANIGDEEVVNSYLDLMNPEHGLLTRYLRAAKVALIFNDILFVHGAVKEYNINYVPSDVNNSNSSFDNLHSWVNSLNYFAHSEVNDYQERTDDYLGKIPTSTLWEKDGGYDHPQPGSKLVQYAMGWLNDYSVNKSVIYASYLSRKGTPDEPSSELIRYFARNNIHKVVVGHQPNGDAPWIIRKPIDDTDKDVLIINADSAYSRNVEWPKYHLRNIYNISSKNDTEIPEYISIAQYETEKNEPTLSTRSNKAVNEVLFLLPDNTDTSKRGCSQVRVRGTLSDGSNFKYILNHHRNNETHDHSHLIGRKTRDGWYVKASNVNPIHKKSSENTPWFLLSHSQGHSFKNKFISFKQLREELMEREEN